MMIGKNKTKVCLHVELPLSCGKYFVSEKKLLRSIHFNLTTVVCLITHRTLSHEKFQMLQNFIRVATK